MTTQATTKAIQIKLKGKQDNNLITIGDKKIEEIVDVYVLGNQLEVKCKDTVNDNVNILIVDLDEICALNLKVENEEE